MRDIQNKIGRILETVRQETGVPGLAVAVDCGGSRYFSACGTAKAGTDAAITRDARFDVSCLMKLFLSVTALKLAAQGRLDLQAPVEALLPELGEPRGIRLIHLMSHASGYHGLDITEMAVRWGSKWDNFAARFRRASQLFPPGSTFNYEHSEHVILGEALRRASGAAPLQLAHDLLLTPAGAQLRNTADPGISSHAFAPRTGDYVAAQLPPFGPFWEGSLPAMTITLDDVVSAVQAALAEDAIANGLRAPLIGLPLMARSETRAEQPPRQFSAACGIYESGLLGHNGSMFGQTVGFRADTNSGAVAAIGVNAYSAYARDTALRRVLDALAGVEDEPSFAKPAVLLWHAREIVFADLPPDAVIGRYIGSYLGELLVERNGEDLRVMVGPAGNRQSSFKIVADGDLHAIQSRAPVSLHFQKAPDGKPMVFLGVHAYKM
jgi:CubicO group peptidase (beta-lactamase class C family)